MFFLHFQLEKLRCTCKTKKGILSATTTLHFRFTSVVVVAAAAARESRGFSLVLFTSILCNVGRLQYAEPFTCNNKRWKTKKNQSQSVPTPIPIPIPTLLPISKLFQSLTHFLFSTVLSMITCFICTFKSLAHSQSSIWNVSRFFCRRCYFSPDLFFFFFFCFILIFSEKFL